MLPGKKRTSKLSLRKQHQRPSSSVFQQPRSPLHPVNPATAAAAAPAAEPDGRAEPPPEDAELAEEEGAGPEPMDVATSAATDGGAAADPEEPDQAQEAQDEQQEQADEDDYEDDYAEEDGGDDDDDYSDDEFEAPPEKSGVAGLAARLAGGRGSAGLSRPQRGSTRLRAEAASAGAEAKGAGLDDPIPEEAQALRQRNIDAMLGNTLQTTRAPVMNLLSVPICLRPFKRPRGAMRTQQSDVLLRKKTLGVRRRGTGYFPGKAMPRPLDMLDLPAEEEASTAAIPPHEPLVLWTPPEGSPAHWTPITVDPIMCHRLRPHQREGVQFCFDCVAGLKKFKGAGCILADDMGLGKTFQSITLIWTLLKQGLPKSVEGSGYQEPQEPEAKDSAQPQAKKAKTKKALPAAQPDDSETAIVISSDSDDDDDGAFADAPSPKAKVDKAPDAAAVDGDSKAEGGEAAPVAISTAEPVDTRESEVQEPMAKKVIVVCPTSLIGNWDNEINKWLPDGKIRTCPLEQGPKVKSNIEGFLGTWGSSPQVLIVSYETFRMHSERFRKPGSCDLLICDEAHRLKNDATMTNQCLDSLPCHRRILLSGTPMQNDLGEFYAMVNFINPGVLGDQAYFRRHFERPCLAGREPDATDSQRERGDARSDELSAIVNDFIIRRTNELLSAHLPPKLIQIVCCKLSPLQTELYMHFVNAVLSQRMAKTGGTGTLGCILALKKLCNHPKLIYDAMHGYDDEAKAATAGFRDCAHLFPETFSNTRGQRAEFGDLIEFSGKFGVLDRLLHYLRTQTKDRIVLVSNYTQTLDLFMALCRCRNYPCIRLDGSVGVAKRTKLVNALNDMSRDQFVFLLSSKAGGCGLNLVGANRLILFDPDWNPANDKQAAARVWRDGQTKKVYEYRFLASGSIEEKVFQRQLSKEGLASVVSSDKGSVASSFSADDLRELFTLRADCVSDTLDSFKDGKEDEDMAEDSDGAAKEAPVDDKPKNPLSINMYDACEGYKPQFGQPGDEQLLLYGHHWANALHTLNDAALRDAVGDDVSFVFSKEVDGCDLSKFG